MELSRGKLFIFRTANDRASGLSLGLLSAPGRLRGKTCSLLRGQTSMLVLLKPQILSMPALEC
jgi:hypothetical protein